MIRVKVLISIIFCTILFSQPGWTYNPNDFGDTGSITSVININGTQVGGPGDLLGAFSNGVCRGYTSSTSTPMGYYFFLTVYGEFGDTLDFKYYDSATDLIYPILETVDFSPNMILGDYASPLILTSSSDQIPDCNGVYGGSAFIDSCGVCSEGNTGHPADSDMDCMEICFGQNILDDYGDCCESPPNWYQDTDGDGLGYELYSVIACFSPTGYVSNADDQYPNCFSNIVDCAGTCDGTFILDTFNNCCAELTTWYSDLDGDGLGDLGNPLDACNQPTGYVSNSDDSFPTCNSNIVDCLGVCDGLATLDVCGVCNGNGSECADCQGIPNGSAFIDDCGICSGGLTGHEPNSDMDCLGNCFGEAIEDPNSVCCNTWDIDCAGYCFGTHGTILWSGNEYYFPNGENEPYDNQEIWINAESYPILDSQGIIRITTDGWDTFLDIPMNSETGENWPNNVHYFVNIGTFPAGTNLEYAIHIISCTDWWLNNDGNNYQILVSDSDNDDDGILNWDDQYPDCAANFIDCNGDCGGEAAIDFCGYCSGGNTGLVPDYADLGCGCDMPGPSEYCPDTDGDGLGMGPSQLYCESDVPDGYVIDCSDSDDNCYGNTYDCTGTCNGTAFIDDCGICSEGSSGHIANSDQDCEGVCNGNAVMDDCGICSDGTTNHDYNSDMDCNGDCFGLASPDLCGICSGGNSGHEFNSDIDDCGVCFGNNEAQDCTGMCFGTASLDMCGICSGGDTGILPDLDVDDCGVCFGNNNDMDCNGVCFGTATLDDCNTCTGGNTGLQPNYLMDCDSVCNGSAQIDDCGICSGGETGIQINENMDCFGECFGLAQLDECEVCSGGNSGIIPNSDLDECGICFGPGMLIWYFDGDADGLGDPDSTQYECEQPDQFVSNSDDQYPDCSVNIYDNFNICGGSNTIQGAIDMTEPWGTVTIPAGVYLESILIDKPLTLTGDPDAVIRISGSSSIINIQSDDVVIENLTIEMGELVSTGIKVYSGFRRVSIQNNTIHSFIELTTSIPNYITGISINGHTDVPEINDYIVQGNIIENVNTGIKLDPNSHHALVTQNLIQDLALPNPDLSASPYPIGIQVRNSNDIQLMENSISNLGIGFYILESTGSSIQNIFQFVNIFALVDEFSTFSSSGFPDFAKATIIFPDFPILYGYFADLQEAFEWAAEGSVVYWYSNGEIIEYIQDCTGAWGGSALIDDCGDCTGGTTGLEFNYSDLGCGCDEPAAEFYCIDNDGDGQGFGTPELYCLNDLPSNYVSDCTDTDDTCNGNTYDCEGTCNGSALTDDCGFCVQPENFNWAMDDCGVCFGDNASMDCAGVCDGPSVMDNCGTCDDNPDNDCIEDCTGVWGGSALIDDCGDCTGGTT
ncbi:MAG: hypothetical protein ACE5D7_00500, partial [Fidelibacterota bacterium]